MAGEDVPAFALTLVDGRRPHEEALAKDDCAFVVIDTLLTIIYLKLMPVLMKIFLFLCLDISWLGVNRKESGKPAHGVFHKGLYFLTFYESSKAMVISLIILSIASCTGNIHCRMGRGMACLQQAACNNGYCSNVGGALGRTCGCIRHWQKKPRTFHGAVSIVLL